MSATVVAQRNVRFQRLIWLMPAAFAPHIAEEYGTGFPDWVTQTLGGAMTAGAFLTNNALFMVILLSLTALATWRPSRVTAFVLLSWASGNLFWNAVFHLVTTALYGRYSPGLMTAVLLYLPVSLLVARAALRERVLPLGAFAGATCIGGVLMLLVIEVGLFGMVS